MLIYHQKMMQLCGTLLNEQLQPEIVYLSVTVYQCNVEHRACRIEGRLAH
jgi:hypothetical protein